MSYFERAMEELRKERSHIHLLPAAEKQVSSSACVYGDSRWPSFSVFVVYRRGEE